MAGARPVALVVDNGSLSTQVIVREVERRSWRVRVVDCAALERGADRVADAAILTGTDVPAHASVYARELELIRECRVPLLGICGGMQLIGCAYGSRLLPCEPVVGRCRVSCMPGVELFAGLDRELVLFSRHRFRLEGVPEQLQAIAWSDACPIEGLRHRERPVFGMQAHVEFRRAGLSVLDNFLRLSGPRY